MNASPPRRTSIFATVVSGCAFATVFGTAGYVGSQYVDASLFAGILKYAIGIIGVVWVLSLTVYQKLSDATDIAGIDYRQHRHLETEVRARLQWFWMRAMFLAAVAIVLALPSILIEAKLSVPPWMLGAACGAFAMALFSLRRLWVELEEIRELRSHIKEIERREAERESQIRSLKEGRKGTWEKDERLEGFRTPPPAP